MRFGKNNKLVHNSKRMCNENANHIINIKNKSQLSCGLFLILVSQLSKRAISILLLPL